MLLTFLVCSIGLAHAEPDITSSRNAGSRDAPGETGSDASVGDGDDRDADVPIVDDDDDNLPDTRDTGTLDDRFDGPPPVSDDEVADTTGDGDGEDDGVPHAPTWAESADAREAALRQHVSWLGRIDLSVTWRRVLTEATSARRDEVWLVGTWRL